MAPIRNAVRLIDHQQPDAVCDGQENLLDESVVREALRGDEHGVRLARDNGPREAWPLIRVRRVYADGSDVEPLRRFDLVTHQGQKRRYDQRRTGAAVTQHAGRNEVDRTLAPAGALDDQEP